MPIVPETSRLEGSFDVVVACEVLEHVEDDLAEIRSWADRLRPGAALVVTVPAHPQRFGASDVWAGHVRRYRREDLVRLATSAGLAVRRLVCFGFPFGNVVEPIRHRVHARRLRRERASSRTERTARSGIERGFESRLGPGWWLLPFCWIQLPFFSTDRGTSYLLVGTRR